MSPPSIVILIVVGVIAFDVLIAAAIGKGVVLLLWNPLADKNDTMEPSAHAVRKNFQSFRFGKMNLGFSVHVVVDERHITLIAIRPLRWLGAKPICIPWEQITLKKQGRKWSSVQIDGRNVHGPAWCLNLADPQDNTTS